MRKFFIKILCILTFILTFVQGVWATNLNINSVSYDNSGAFLTINSYDNEAFSFNEKPVLYIDDTSKKAYIDIKPAVLDCTTQNFVLNNSSIKQITISQQSIPEKIVRIAFAYSDGYNPKNIQLRKLNNTLFLRFKNPTINNYYFQGVYQENSPQEFFEPISMEIPVEVSNDNILGQINSAFEINTTKSYILEKKDLALKSKYYLNSYSVEPNGVILYGLGSFSLSKPFYLSNPNRVVYDIKNAMVNPSFHNKPISIGSDTLKIGQFDKTTVRLVITAPNPEKYVPIIFADSQRIALVDKFEFPIKDLFSQNISMTSAQYEKSSSNTQSFKLIFNSRLLFGLDRDVNALNLQLYNVSGNVSNIINKAFENTPFSNAKVVFDSNNVMNLSIPAVNEDKFDIHIGSDGKTLRIKKTFKKLETHKDKPEFKMPELNLSEVVPALRKGGKKAIVIDAGHGGSDCGALRGNVREKDITLDIAKRVEKDLIKKGYAVTMTRTEDETVSLQDRVDISEAVMPDIFVSIHVNSSNSENPSGLETHYYKDNSLGLAKFVHAAMLNNINSNDRGLFKSKFYVINHTTAPAILVEIGFLSNPKERSQLVTDSRKEATAKAIVEGIDEYFK